LRETKAFLRDKILCRESNGHVGNVQNNLALGDYKGKHVAMFRASDTVLDCAQGTIIDFPSWKALREMIGSNKAELTMSVPMLLGVAGEAEDEVVAGNAEVVKEEPGEQPAAKRARQSKPKVDPEAWRNTELGEYPNAIHLVCDVKSDAYARLVEEAKVATLVCFDAQWAPDFDEGSDNPIAIVQLAFPISGNTYVLQLPMLEFGFPIEVQRLFERPSVQVVGFSANEIDIHKFTISGIKVDEESFWDVQPWCEAEMGENDSVKQGWRVGLKRAAFAVLDFEMDKTQTVASSNWERDELTTAQVEYGAMDVWVALRIYQRLSGVYGGA